MPSTVLREQQSKDEVIRFVSGQLLNIATLYQIEKFGAPNALILAEWIFENYPCDDLETVCMALENFRGEDKLWRLNPDTVREAMTQEIERKAGAVETKVHNEPFKEVDSEWEDSRLTEWLKEIEKVEAKKIPSLTQEDILKEGQEKPAKPIIKYSTKEQHEEHERRRKWMLECTDIYTGRIKPGAPTYEQWLDRGTAKG